MKAVILKHREWDQIFAKIKEDYADSPATYLIRNRMKDVLGFTQREHTVWRSSDDEDDLMDWRDSRSQIHLDFYSESARTMFLLRYMNRD